MTAIVTVPPYAPFLQDVARHPIVTGLRLNTVMPVKEPLEDVLQRLQDIANGKTMYVDLKGRQLRTTGYATPPFTEVRVSHRIEVDTPVTAYFGNGREQATLVGVDGYRLLFQEGPRRVVGPGESINIPDESLRIHGTLTKTDKDYVAAACKVGLHDYMLSYVESGADVGELLALDPKANVVAKIESRTGLQYVKLGYKQEYRLMAARGDLFVEVDKPHNVLDALELIIAKDGNAIAASRIFPSLADSLEPSCQDITDAAYLLKLGYKTLMLGDEVCMREKSVMSCLNLLESIENR